ncbi:hypothetical protein K1719_024096 [Acacia pycnantha]|nr:hypothetical protein K1719_024096 [Acacia pycnantha]
MWLRNPFTRVSNNTNEDLQISTDSYLGNPRSGNHNINTGFYFVRLNSKTISLFETWYGKKDISEGQKGQDVLDGLLRQGIWTLFTSVGFVKIVGTLVLSPPFMPTVAGADHLPKADADVMWLRNPFTRLGNDTNDDLQISTDRYLGDPRSEKHDINTGFYFVRTNNKTISLFETWYSKKDNSTGQKGQGVRQDLIRHGITRQLGVWVRFMDTIFFSGFCQNSEDFRAVTTVLPTVIGASPPSITGL